jgi:hypothetical protein
MIPGKKRYSLGKYVAKVVIVARSEGKPNNADSRLEHQGTSFRELQLRLRVPVPIHGITH